MRKGRGRPTTTGADYCSLRHEKTRNASLSFINNEHAEIGEELLSADIEMGIGERTDIDDVRLANFCQKVAENFVKTIMANFDAVGMADGLGSNSFVAVFGYFERWQRLFDKTRGWGFMHGHAEVHFD